MLPQQVSQVQLAPLVRLARALPEQLVRLARLEVSALLASQEQLALV